LSQPFVHGLADLRFEGGTLSKELLELLPREHHELRVFVRDGTLRVGPAEQQGVLAEGLSRPCARPSRTSRIRTLPESTTKRASASVSCSKTTLPARQRKLQGGTDELEQRPVADLRKQRNAPQGSHEAV
jgi:hypothetical protein